MPRPGAELRLFFGVCLAPVIFFGSGWEPHCQTSRARRTLPSHLAMSMAAGPGYTVPEQRHATADVRCIPAVLSLGWDYVCFFFLREQRRYALRNILGLPRVLPHTIHVLYI